MNHHNESSLIYLEHSVSGVLGEYVAGMVFHQAYQPGHDKEKLLPDGTANWVIELLDEPKAIYDNLSLNIIQRCEQSWFAGLQSQYLTIASGQNAKMLVVTFKAQAAGTFIKGSAEVCANQVRLAADFMGEEVTSLRSQLMANLNPEAMFALLESFLDARIPKATIQQQVVATAVEHIQSTSGQLKLTELVAQSGYSQRRFTELFKLHVGLTPKQYHRIIRFNQILSSIHQQDSFNWLTVAQDCGYFDQAHFIRDFKSFAGINPSQYSGFETDWKNYLSVPNG